MPRASLQYRLRKAQNLEAGEEALDILAALDFKVTQFGRYHFRINDRLDVWPSNKKFYDIISHNKGTYKELEEFVVDYFKEFINVKITNL